MKSILNRKFQIAWLAVGFLALLSTIGYPLLATAQVTAFTYQGRLNDTNNSPANGLYDFQFTVYVSESNPGSVAGPILLAATPVTNGLFTVKLDFGGVYPFPGFDRWLGIDVRTNGSGPFTTLSPRQQVTPTPYAMTAQNLLSGGQFGNPVNFNNPANSFSGNGGGLTNVNAMTLDGYGYCSLPCYWNVTGNAGTSPGLDFVGTSDNLPLSLKVNNTLALQLVPGTSLPNVVGARGATKPSVLASGVSGVVIAGGNAPSSGFSGFGAGDFMAAFDNDGAIGGGFGNKVGTDNGDTTDAPFATVGGGIFNTAANFGATVGGGAANTASGTRAVVAGGNGNTATADYSGIGAGFSNTTSTNSTDSFVGGGRANTIRRGASESTIGGGLGNSAGGVITNTTIIGATVAGGVSNRADCAYSFVGGGKNNLVSDVAGFQTTPFPSPFALIAGGENNFISNDGFTAGDHSAIGGGLANQIQGGTQSVIAGGGNNTIDGSWSTIPGGQYNVANGNYNFAAGHNAQTYNNGTFIWADSGGTIFNSTGDNQFCIRASGGIQVSAGTSMFFGTTTRQMLNLFGNSYGIGAQTLTEYFRSPSDFSWYLGGVHNNGQNNPGGGTELMRLYGNGNLQVSGGFGSLSDRNAKEKFEPISSRDVLDKVASLPVSRWSYKTDPRTRHVGPMAQDFYAAFDVGTDDKHITLGDEGGVALAAIQGLNEKVESENSQLRAENAELKQRLERLEKFMLRNESH